MNEYVLLINELQLEIKNIKDVLCNSSNEIGNKLQIILGKSELLDIEVEEEIRSCSEYLKKNVTNDIWLDIDRIFLKLYEREFKALKIKKTEKKIR